MTIRALSISIMSLTLLSGCASLPDVAVGYYPVKAVVTLTTVETVACDSTHRTLVYAASTTATTAGQADWSAGQSKIRLKKSTAGGEDLASSFTLTPDGRLSGINITNTGEGESIAKSVVAVASAALVIAMDQVGGAPPTPIVTKQQCTVLSALSDKGPLTMTFTGTADFGAGSSPTTISMEPDAVGKQAISAVPAIPIPIVTITNGAVIEPPASGGVTSDNIPLILQKMQPQTIKVTIANLPDWKESILLPSGQNYEIPIPRGKLFGSNSVAIAISDLGAVTSIGYGKTSGSSSALNAIGDVAGLFTPASVAQRDQDRADEIAEQQRLVSCRADLATCKTS